MRQDTRLSRTLHVLLHLDQMDGPVTSGTLATMLQTNAAVVRRIMGGLRDAGVVTSAKGHGGGWSLAKPLTEISLLSVYEALGPTSLFTVGNDDAKPTCVLARAANDATSAALKAARTTFEDTLKKTFVSDLASASTALMRGRKR